VHGETNVPLLESPAECREVSHAIINFMFLAAVLSSSGTFYVEVDA
jgi:hypothetical protein